VLFKEDFGGNDPSDPAVSPTGLPTTVTNYIYTTNLWAGNWGYYTIAKVTPWQNSYDTWYNLDDHTYPNDPTRGYMFITDAKEDANQFYQYVINDLCPGSRLSFSAWLVSMVNVPNAGGAKAKIVFV